MKNQIKPPGLPEVVMARAAENELYSELFWNRFTRKEIHAKWRLRNPKQICWPRKLQLVPVLTFPEVQVSLESYICQLEGLESADLQVKL